VKTLKNHLILLAVSMVAMASVSYAQEIDATSENVAVEDTGAFLKRIVAIARFSNETTSGTTFLIDNSGDRLGKQASDILSARLVSTGRFLMFERTDVDEVEAEKVMSGILSSGVPVDYLIVGSVSEFGRSVESETGIISKAKTQKAYAKVNIRLIEVATGRIVYSDEGAGEATSTVKRTFGVGGSAAYDQSLTDKAISAAISELVSSIVDNLTKKQWMSSIIAEEDGQFIIAGGSSQGIREGDMFQVMRRGKSIKNPQTGAMIELPGKRVASLKIQSTYGDDSFSEISFATVTDGSLEEDFSQYYVVE